MALLRSCRLSVHVHEAQLLQDVVACAGCVSERVQHRQQCRQQYRHLIQMLGSGACTHSTTATGSCSSSCNARPHSMTCSSDILGQRVNRCASEIVLDPQCAPSVVCELRERPLSTQNTRWAARMRVSRSSLAAQKALSQLCRPCTGLSMPARCPCLAAALKQCFMHLGCGQAHASHLL